MKIRVNRRAVATFRKAVGAALLATLGVIGTALLAGEITRVQLIGAVGAGLLAGLGTYQIPNAPQDPVDDLAG